jgi:hypothetical protein
VPVKIFAGNAAEAAALETKINEWMARLEPGAVRQISAAAADGAQQVVVTVWYTESRDRN